MKRRENKVKYNWSLMDYKEEALAEDNWGQDYNHLLKKDNC